MTQITVPTFNWTQCDPLDEYERPSSWLGLEIWIHPTLYKKTGCKQDNLSLTTMKFAEKNYKRYGDWALGIGILIAIFMLVLCFNLSWCSINGIVHT